MVKKIIHFDTETTGLDPVLHDPIQIAGAIEIEHKGIVEEFNIKCQPIDKASVSEEALEVHGMSMKEIMSFQPPRLAHQELLSIFGNHIDKYSKFDKAFIGGYNVKFDVDMLASWFKKLGDKYIGSWWNWRTLDPLPFVNRLDYIGKIDLPNHKLETVCEHFGIEIKAHDALSDIRATVKLIHKLVIGDG